MVISPVMVEIISGVDPVWRLLLDGWDQTLQTAGKSGETRTAYRKAGVAFVNWLAVLPTAPAGWMPPRTGVERRAARRAAADAGVEAMPTYRPTAADEITRQHVERFLIAFATESTPRCPDGRSDSTVNQTFRSLQGWFAWLLDEEEIETSPMERMDPPKIGERVKPLLEVDQLSALVAVCKGKDFTSRRDEAIIRTFADSGGRRGEVAGLDVDDVDLTRKRLLVTGKGDRQRYIAIGAQTALSINRYLRLRARHRHATLPALWLAERGTVMTPSGIYQVVKRRGREAGIEVHPHLFRHALADAWLSAGGGEQTLADHMGWSTTQMVRRYGAAGRSRRAQDEHERLGLGDRI
jgi:site-specific recombinase XerD